MGLVLRHEGEHIKMHHPWWKMANAISMALFWWSPLHWAAYRLTNRDMELACDRAVLNRLEPEGRREVTGRIVPIYPLTAGVSQLILSRSIRQGLDACADILPDVLPDRVRQHHQLCRIEYAYENIHFPESAEALDLARRRLAFEELFLFTIGLERLRSRREVVHVPPCGGVDMELFYRALPFTLTDAQRRCVEEALADMRSGTPMNRLCQGDVGSGKTMVAAACVYFMVKNGRQAALMAPTEILAQQHYQGLAPLLENLGIRCALLTGSTTAKTKRSITQGRSTLPSAPTPSSPAAWPTATWAWW